MLGLISFPILVSLGLMAGTYWILEVWKLALNSMKVDSTASYWQGLIVMSAQIIAVGLVCGYIFVATGVNPFHVAGWFTTGLAYGLATTTVFYHSLESVKSARDLMDALVASWTSVASKVVPSAMESAISSLSGSNPGTVTNTSTLTNTSSTNAAGDNKTSVSTTDVTKVTNTPNIVTVTAPATSVTTVTPAGSPITSGLVSVVPAPIIMETQSTPTQDATAVDRVAQEIVSPTLPSQISPQPSLQDLVHSATTM